MKPAHLGPLYASQFQDPSVVQAYRFRPPYPSTVFDILEKEWSVVIPKVAASLVPGAVLALVERDNCGLAWDSELRELIQRYSTNREYRPYDLVGELVNRGLFTETGRRTTASTLFVQSLEDHVESIHSRNGFSRDRMTVESPAEFDRLYQRLLERHCRDGIVTLETTATVVWGIPLAA